MCYFGMQRDYNIWISLEGSNCSYLLSSFNISNPTLVKHRIRSLILIRATLNAVTLSVVPAGAAGNSER